MNTDTKRLDWLLSRSGVEWIEANLDYLRAGHRRPYCTNAIDAAMSSETGYKEHQLRGREVPRDVCARKHGGNEQSKAAFNSISESLSDEQKRTLTVIKIAPDGATLDEICQVRSRTPNQISGRITELRIMGKIEKRGTRKTRSGCSASVWVAK